MRIFHLLIIGFLFISIHIHAQVSKKVLVEHFTNTRCSICASRNPGFYSNLNSQPQVIHIAFHPSAPYTACLLNNYNVSENDSRTNYYGVYGSTPRLVINGVVIASSADYSSPSIFTPYSGQAAAFIIKMSQVRTGTDSIRVKITVIKQLTVSYNTATLFAGIFEDSIFYSAPNGETKHYDVFRNSYTGAQGTMITLPVNPGDSVTYVKTIKLSQTLNNGRIYSLAILQHSSTKELLQAEKTMTIAKQSGTGIQTSTIENIGFDLFPNPAQSKITVKSVSPELKHFVLLNSIGKELESHSFVSSFEIDLSVYPAGVYYIRVSNAENSSQRIFIRQ